MGDAGGASVKKIAGGKAGKTKPAGSLRGRVPTISPSHLTPLQALFEYPRQWHLADGGRLAFSPGSRCDDAATFAVDADGVSMALRLEQGPHADGTMAWSDYQGRSRVLAWSLANETRLARLSDALGMALVPVLPPTDGVGADVAERAAVDTDADSVWLNFAINEPDLEGDAAPQPCSGLLRLPIRCLAPLLARAGDPYGEDPPLPLDAWLTLPAAVVIGFAGPDVPVVEWRTLVPGSVIVAGRASSPPRVEAIACGRVWPLAATAQGWRIDGEYESMASPQENPMTSNDKDATPQEDRNVESRAGVEQLSVGLRFDLGTVELTIAELSGLQPGYVFALAAQLEGTNVAIRANGRQIGRGEVVAVGDTLGVRLLGWS